MVQDQLGWFHRGRAEMDHADEHGAAARHQRPEARPDPAGPVQHQAGGDDRVDDQADGEGVDLLGDRPADRVPADQVVQVMAQRHRQRQPGQPVQDPVMHRSLLRCRDGGSDTVVEHQNPRSDVSLTAEAFSASEQRCWRVGGPAEAARSGMNAWCSCKAHAWSSFSHRAPVRRARVGPVPRPPAGGGGAPRTSPPAPRLLGRTPAARSGAPGPGRSPPCRHA